MIPTSHLEKIFQQNIGNKYTTKNPFEGPHDYNGTLTVHALARLSRLHPNFFTYVSILKRSLESVTNDEEMEVAKVCGFDSDVTGKTICNYLAQPKGYITISILSAIKVNSYLTSRNIALDITLSDEEGKPVIYTVKQLVENGTYKIIG